MFCPICRAEYREGFLECTDCDVDLVEKLGPQPKIPGFVKLATIFREGNIAVIKASFDKTEIYIILTENNRIDSHRFHWQQG